MATTPQPTKQAGEDVMVVIDPDMLPTTMLPGDSAMAVDQDATDTSGKPKFKALHKQALVTGGRQQRRILIPQHRMAPLKTNWLKIYNPIVEHLKLDIRVNPRQRSLELRTNKLTEDSGAIQKATDFIRAFTLGFDVDDAIALLRLDDLYIDSFEIKDVKSLQGDHLSRAIGRIAGKGGKTKFTIENATKTRIALADTKIHIMGSFQNIKVARDAVVSLILGSPPGKVYSTLRTISARMKERF
ncbi:pre-rRNA-processing protein pno1 [Dispira parvispora]|uniref:Pre-rRNA-processing protein PNO1 n=1 Tax=Dispira parvispora TaxID=1520584 RepID=A0A9W8E5H5_9FUNG|nr:pre-rRNA-processing protein pno1 [Dispira parvispora]